MGVTVDYTKKQPKVNVTVRVDPVKLEEAKKRRLNISNIVRDALDKELNGSSSPKADVKGRRKGA